MNENQIIAQEKKYFMPVFKRNHLVLVKGKGVYVWDIRGKKYLDLLGGIAVNSLGHCHPHWVRAVKKQAETLVHTSNLYYTLPQLELAEKLVTLSFPAQVFFSNSGAEANECAIKLSRKWGEDVQSLPPMAGQAPSKVKRYEIITFTNSFHGRTMATLSLTGQEKIRRGYAPLCPGFRYVNFNDLESTRKAINKKTCAIMVELIQGEGGVNLVHPEFIRGLRNLCNKYKLLLIFDEVQTGIGRTGKFFAYQHYGVKPDIMTLAKGLGGGLPIGATLARTEMARLFQPGDHGSTFGGGPLICQSALSVIREIEENNLLKQVCGNGEWLIKELQKLQASCKIIKGVRGQGLMVAVELEKEGKDIVQKCQEQGLLLNCTAQKVLRLLPPLIIKRKELKQGLLILAGALKDESQY